MMKKHVLTGGPGIGKTTVIDLLSKKGYSTLQEVAREIIAFEQASGGDALPWKDGQKFQTMVMERQLEIESDVQMGHTFLDRGLVDGYGYCRHFGVEVPSGLLRLGVDRYDNVFILDRIPNYQNDSSRLEDSEEAAKIHESILSAYIEFGYNPIAVPVLEPQERANFILNRI